MTDDRFKIHEYHKKKYMIFLSQGKKKNPTVSLYMMIFLFKSRKSPLQKCLLKIQTHWNLIVPLLNGFTSKQVLANSEIHSMESLSGPIFIGQD
jgi:ABC-type tungstate transport system substrate-binding protein